MYVHVSMFQPPPPRKFGPVHGIGVVFVFLFFFFAHSRAGVVRCGASADVPCSRACGDGRGGGHGASQELTLSCTLASAGEETSLRFEVRKSTQLGIRRSGEGLWGWWGGVKGGGFTSSGQIRGVGVTL